MVFLTNNRQPWVTEVTVYPQARGVYHEGDDGGEGGGTTVTQKLPGGITVKYIQNGAERGQSKGQWLTLRGMRTIGWKAWDPDKDTLHYDVFIRKTDEKEWRVVGEDLTTNFTSFDTGALPEGKYIAKVVVNDSASNPYGQGLTHELESKVFTVDNTSPEVTITAFSRDKKGLKLAFTAKDATNIIVKAEFSVDNREFQNVSPVGGMFDSKSEDFAVTVKPEDVSDKVKVHTLIVRVTDSEGNLAVATATTGK